MCLLKQQYFINRFLLLWYLIEKERWKLVLHFYYKNDTLNNSSFFFNILFCLQGKRKFDVRSYICACLLITDNIWFWACLSVFTFFLWNPVHREIVSNALYVIHPDTDIISQLSRKCDNIINMHRSYYLHHHSKCERVIYGIFLIYHFYMLKNTPFLC